MFWLTEGDTNSKFFHAAASRRKKLNHISHLITEENVVIENHEEMCNLAGDYFRKVFTGESSDISQIDDEED